METKHTPGPWRWAAPHPGQFELVAGIERVMWRGRMDDDGCDSGLMLDIDPNSPDARLIAAAPELLEALLRMEEHFREWQADDKYTTDLFCLARAAINKAIGA